MTTPNKIDSNATGLAYAEETTPKVLPGSPLWYNLEPNSYSDFGGDYTHVSRTPLNANRRKKRGATTGISAVGGFNQDLTMNNLFRLMQGFFCSSIRQKPATITYAGVSVAFTSVATSDDSYNAASGLAVFLAKHLVLASGFTNSGNNGLKNVVTVAAGKVTVSQNLTDEGSPPAAGKLEAVGVQFASGDITLAYSAPTLTLGSTVFDFTTLGLIVGEWIFLGGDSAAMCFATAGVGYARIGSIAAHAIVLDKSTFTAVADAGTSKTIQMFFGNVLKDEDSGSFVKRTYNLERTLGNDGVGVQSQYIEGWTPNEITLNIPKQDKLVVDITGVGLDESLRTGTTGVKSGTHVASPNETAINTSSDVYRQRIAVVDGTMNPTATWGYVTNGTIKISNGVEPNEAVGLLGAFDTSLGDFEVTGDFTAYFATIDAQSKIRANTAMTFDTILARDNQAKIFDLPLIEISGGRLTIEKDKPVMLPVKQGAVECGNSYTMLMDSFPYVPTIAVPA